MRIRRIMRGVLGSLISAAEDCLVCGLKSDFGGLLRRLANSIGDRADRTDMCA